MGRKLPYKVKLVLIPGVPPRLLPWEVHLLGVLVWYLSSFMCNKFYYSNNKYLSFLLCSITIVFTLSIIQYFVVYNLAS